MAIMCKICGAKPAQIHYTEIVNNKVITVDLCHDCAHEKGIDLKKGLDFKKGKSYGIGDLIANQLGSVAQTEAEKIGRVNCSACGYDYSDFKKVGRFGCPECYTAFSEQLSSLLRHIHGSTQHKGKTPVELGPQAVKRRELIELKEQLALAIENEAYEKAAEIRDRIKQIESEQKED